MFDRKLKSSLKKKGYGVLGPELEDTDKSLYIYNKAIGVRPIMVGGYDSNPSAPTESELARKLKV